MIKANELRIGNKINKHFEGGDAQEIDVTTRDIFDCQTNPTGKFTYTGIPITEELLINIGFYEYKIENILTDKKAFRIDRGAFANIYFSDGHLIIDSMTGYYKMVSQIKIKYVHQLQNLYFALTGEELTL